MTPAKQHFYEQAKQYGLTEIQAETMSIAKIMQFIAEHEGQTVIFEPVKPIEVIKQEIDKTKILLEIENANTKDTLRAVWDNHPSLQFVDWFKQALTHKKNFLISEGIITLPPIKEDYRSFNSEQGEEVIYYNDKQVF